ncbi:MAG: hypothetical protein VX833_03050 [Actinomycetota bacterium]|nr:hypothetical protein [Actinomycetota bacterium]
MLGHALVVGYDSRTPVIVGAAQVTDRIEDPTTARTPLELMVDAVRSAAVDAGTTTVLRGLDVIAVVGGLWSYPDPGRQIAQGIGADSTATLLTEFSGHIPQALVNDIAGRIQSGDLSSAVVCGGEANRAARRARRAGTERRRDADSSLPPAERFGPPLVMTDDVESERGVLAPAFVYPVIDSAIRHARGETIKEHRDRIAELWAGFSVVASQNPHAARQEMLTANEIKEPSDGNRMVGFPYTVAMNANNNVDQASAVIICSTERARELGVPIDRWVFIHAGALSTDTPRLTNRHELHRSPGVRHAGQRCLELAGAGVDDLAHVDLYSCFPSSVQVSASEIGLDIDRSLTVTGGLTFAGAPINNYSGQALAAMVHRLRAEPGLGFIHANGGYMTSHAMAVYGTEPPPAGHFAHAHPQTAVDEEPTRSAGHDHFGPTTVEAYSVIHNRAGKPEWGLVALRTPTDSRTWGRITDAARLSAMMEVDYAGQPAELAPNGIVSA